MRLISGVERDCFKKDVRNKQMDLGQRNSEPHILKRNLKNQAGLDFSTVLKQSIEKLDNSKNKL